MKPVGSDKRVWLIATLSGAAGVALIALLFRTQAVPRNVAQASPKSPANSAVALARVNDGGASSRLRDEAMLRDPTPLFLPTRWNAGENALPADARREPGSSFRDYPAKLNFPPSGLQLDLPSPIGVPARPADAFSTDKPKRPLLGIGRSDPPVLAVSPRTAYVEVAAVSDGRRVIAEPIMGGQLASENSWQPLEFLVAIDRAGLVKPAVLLTSSQVATIDAYFREFLSNGLQIGERLAPGFYRVSIGP